MALTPVQECRTYCADLDPALPFLDDSTYEYFLTRHNGSVRKASLDAARSILLLLAQRGSETVDVLSITGGHKAAEQYRLALQMFIKDPMLNPLFTSVQGYAGGISKSDYNANLSNPDNNNVQTPQEALERENPSSLTFTSPYVF